MRIMRKLVPAVLAAALLLSLTAGAASALRSLEISEGRITAVGRHVSLRVTEEETLLICEFTTRITAEGPRIIKREGARVGTAELSIAGCSLPGALRALAGPLSVTYVSFSGTLPNIREITLRQELAILFEWGVGSCLYKANLNLKTDGNPARSLIWGEESIPLFRQEGLVCPREFRLRGTSELTPEVRLTLR